MKQFIQNKRTAEAGNVLFLILIAVALFAALSYAVTSSSRSGGGDANSETNLVNSAQLTQYPSSVRTAIIRMFVSNGVGQDQLNFDAPSAFPTTCNAEPDGCVFHPQGGGATYVKAPAEVMNSGSQGQWIYSSAFQIDNIGTTNAASDDANDVIAFLPGIKDSICKRINEELGISVVDSTDAEAPSGDDIPVGLDVSDIQTEANWMDEENGTVDIGSYVDVLGGDFSAQPFGCFDADDTARNAGGVYYHVLVER